MRVAASLGQFGFEQLGIRASISSFVSEATATFQLRKEIRAYTAWHVRIRAMVKSIVYGV